MQRNGLKNKVKRIDLTLTAQIVGNVTWKQPMDREHKSF